MLPDHQGCLQSWETLQASGSHTPRLTPFGSWLGGDTMISGETFIESLSLSTEHERTFSFLFFTSTPQGRSYYWYPKTGFASWWVLSQQTQPSQRSGEGRIYYYLQQARRTSGIFPKAVPPQQQNWGGFKLKVHAYS